MPTKTIIRHALATKYQCQIRGGEMPAIIISNFDDLQNHIRPTDVHNAILMILYSSNHYHGIVKSNDNEFVVRGCGFESNGPIIDWFSNSLCDENILEFIKERWTYYTIDPNHFRMEVIIIRDPADIQTIVDKYSITNKYYIDEIKSRFITEKSIIPSSRRASESGDLAT